MLGLGRAGVTTLDAGAPSFAPASEPALGNPVPAWTGSPGNTRTRPGPHAQGQQIGGQLGNYDGYSGADPSRPKISPHPRVDINGAEQENWNRPGIIGFNDQLQVRDRHAYWHTGRTLNQGPGTGSGGGRNPTLDGPPSPRLRTVNISVNPQIGSDASRNQDDLSRPYTWLGQQDGSVQPVYGGVPGLWQAYGNRGFAAGIHDPSSGQGGRQGVRSGPPHGLHSDTLPSGKQTADRYASTPQMRPVRFDRPSNSVIAGQSYSQTVQPQGSTQTQWP